MHNNNNNNKGFLRLIFGRKTAGFGGENMKNYIRILTWILAGSLCFALVSPAAMAVEGGMNYYFNATVASAQNELFAYGGSVVTTPEDPSTLDASRGTHYFTGNGNFSRYSSAHVCRTGNAGRSR